MKRLTDQSGMALLLVLLVIALLSTLLIEFSFSNLVDLRASENFRDRAKAYYLAKGGVEAARAILQEDRNEFDHPVEFWGTPLLSIPAGDGDVSLQIRDLGGRMNVNLVADSRGNRLLSYHRFVALCEEVLQIDQASAQALADSLLYWLLADTSQTTPDDGYYASQSPAYERRGGPLESLGELKRVRGFSAEIYQALAPYLRVNGSEAINLNSAAAELLYAWQFSSAEEYVDIVLSRADVDAIVSARDSSPLQQLQDLEQIEGVGERWAAAWAQGSVVVVSSLYAVESEGRVNDGSRYAQAIIDKANNQLLTFKVE